MLELEKFLASEPFLPVNCIKKETEKVRKLII